MPQTELNTANQATSQENQPTSNTVFDPSTLSPEIQRYVDQQRTQASQTARANARKELMKDDSFLSEIRAGMQADVTKQAQMSVEDQIKQLNKRLSTSEVKNVLRGANIPQEQMDSYVALFADENIEDSINRANTFVTTFNASLQAARDAQQQSDIKSMTTPSTSSVSANEQQLLQAELDDARKDTSFRSREVRMASIRRRASEKGITLN